MSFNPHSQPLDPIRDALYSYATGASGIPSEGINIIAPGSTPIPPGGSLMPLYDELYDIAITYTKPIDMVEISRKISALSNMGREKFEPHARIMFALVCRHTDKLGLPLVETSIPFGGQGCAGGRGVLYTINPKVPTLDPLIQIIIALYVNRITTTTTA